MAGEKTTIARPYAEAIFQRAQESNKLDHWSETLELLSAIVSDGQMGNIITNPNLTGSDLAELVISVGGKHLAAEGQNLVKLLVENERLSITPEIAEQFEALKNEAQGAIDVQVTSAFDLESAQEEKLAQALRTKLGREVSITTVKDPSLYGGLIIRAGDMVIDGSIKGQLRKLSTELGI